SLSTLSITTNANLLNLPLSSLTLTIKPNPLELPHDRKHRQKTYNKLNQRIFGIRQQKLKTKKEIYELPPLVKQIIRSLYPSDIDDNNYLQKPDIPSSHSSLANGYNNLAMIQLKQGRFEEALANFERTLQIELAIGNIITGQWYNWRTAYKRQNNQTEWRANLLNAAPKSYLGVIVYFATLGDLKSLQTSLTQLSRTLSNNPRPVVIFHEDNLSNNDIQQSLAQILGNSTPLTFEHIKFSNSSIQPERLHRRCQGTLFETFKKFP
ncbi:unnamed protein product, partial [Rotaria magnacalcarata]